MKVRLQYWGIARNDCHNSRNHHCDHEHYFWQVTVAGGGAFTFFCDNRQYEIAAEDILIIPPHCRHHFRFNEQMASTMTVKFRLDDAPPALSDRFTLVPASRRTGLLISTFHRLLIEFMHDGVDNDTQHEFAVGGGQNAVVIEKFIEAILTFYLGGDQTSSPDLIVQIKNHVRSRQGKAVKAAELARHFGYSQGHLAQLVRSLAGKSLKELLDRERTLMIQRYLEYSEMNIAELAEFLGFSSSIQFCKFFKRMLSMSPGQYRQSCLMRNLKAGRPAAS
ncbi:MAG: AraC family transcriptional regulator [Victivallaceae bacterium]